jgi:hypothetical protein
MFTLPWQEVFLRKLTLKNGMIKKNWTLLSCPKESWKLTFLSLRSSPFPLALVLNYCSWIVSWRGCTDVPLTYTFFVIHMQVEVKEMGCKKVSYLWKFSSPNPVKNSVQLILWSSLLPSTSVQTCEVRAWTDGADAALPTVSLRLLKVDVIHVCCWCVGDRKIVVHFATWWVNVLFWESLCCPRSTRSSLCVNA